MSGSGASAGLSIRALAGGYPGGEDIVRGVDAEIGAGRVSVIVGPNGAGKSTLLKIVAGLLPARRGGVALGGRPLPGGRPREAALSGIGFVPQERNVFAMLSVRENLELGGYLVPRAAARSRLTEQLERFPMLAAKARQRASSLSGGQRQVLALAIALMLAPRALLLDEPSAGLSPIAAAELFATVRRLADEGIAILMVEQNALAALAMADHGMLMVQGEKVREAAARELAADPQTRHQFLGG